MNSVVLRHTGVVAVQVHNDSFFGNLFKVYMPRRYCMFEETPLIWLHLISDAVIALAYFSIPIALVKLVRNRRDLKFNWIFVCFAVFILACGAGHVLDAIAIWSPFYRIAGIVKLITAIASVSTAVVLWPLLPKILSMPSVEEYRVTADNLRAREKALQRSEQLYRSLLEAAPVAMVIVDPAGLIDVVNAKAQDIFGFTAEEMKGRPIEFLIPERFQADHIAKRNGYISAPTPYGMTLVRELVGRKKDGTEFPVEINLNPLQTADGLRVSSAIVDISKRRSLEKQTQELNHTLLLQNIGLEAANKELEAFCYSVSHDLRAPLRSIDGFSQAVLEDCAEGLNAQGREHLERVCGASQRMGHLIDDLLNLSRVSRTELQREQTDLSRITAEVCADCRAGNPDREVTQKITAGVIADADPRLMRIVMTNLLGNAWKFSSKKPNLLIEFGCTDQSGETEYFVRDNGAGFDMAYVEKLFGAFQRLHAERDFPGTGIGLATIQRIIHRHGGKVRAHSTVGEGATFYFTLGDGNGMSRLMQPAATSVPLSKGLDHDK